MVDQPKPFTPAFAGQDNPNAPQDLAYYAQERDPQHPDHVAPCSIQTFADATSLADLHPDVVVRLVGSLAPGIEYKAHNGAPDNHDAAAILIGVARTAARHHIAAGSGQTFNTQEIQEATAEARTVYHDMCEAPPVCHAEPSRRR